MKKFHCPKCNGETFEIVFTTMRDADEEDMGIWCPTCDELVCLLDAYDSGIQATLERAAIQEELQEIEAQKN
jgi:hypothetical protein